MTAMTVLKTVQNDDDAKADTKLPTPRDVREGAKLSVPEMAGLLGMSPFGYEQWESGARRAGGPAYRLLHLIARDGKPVIEALQEVSK